MTHQYQQPGFPPPQQPGFPPPQRPVQKGVGKLAVTLIAVAALAVGCVGGFAIGGAGKAVTSGTSAPVAQSGGEQPVVDETSTEPAAEYTPKRSDFEVTIKTISKKCYGSAGCNVTYRAELAYGGPPLPDDKTYTVSYKLTGGDDSTIGSIDVTGDQMSRPSEEMISTPSSTSVLKAKVTQVL
ncbi:hypothetical protein AB0O34_31565 [Sphaerisporangium sp. NPDC088356]|uniref:hypothetical protein n=1 Tax=Sphaerisporangium sp. NPDC088356 TaxID=3154871 RepID=UPI00342AC6D9